MHLLLSNDDGYLAKGMQVLMNHLKSLGHKITVVAPNGERSGKSHAMSFYDPIRVKKISEEIYAVDGTPADCVALALGQILKEDRPDFVISGINHGMNVGIDVNYSGTVGAATEAAMIGYKAIAVSADSDNRGGSQAEIDEAFLKAAQLVGQVIEQSHTLDWPRLEILNINVPIKARKASIAECGGESLYVPNFDEMIPKDNKNMKIYLIGGVSRFEPQDMSQDVSLVSSGIITFSFVQAKQSSTKSNKKLEGFIGNLKI
ncbi:5'/3'-nucleotidase SurE [Fluviispira multicolorata]|uniref:5'-nucleotidase SurE n=1 Tax=Fluviispira multicolorata TaxID=2654512 RepID=A0A833JDU4_9BACT|nr:5'/3'-nucleotidase SurE [Fluviispira multicolorata]KAB8032055.1 5'/3'-nucleotidase SurE [Fluviispira multicolorata]